MKRIVLLALAFWLAGSSWQYGLAHGDEKHEKKDTTEQVTAPTHEAADAVVHTRDEEGMVHSVEGKAQWEDFPTLHPLVVHFPIVLLPIALVLQLLTFFYRK